MKIDDLTYYDEICDLLNAKYDKNGELSMYDLNSMLQDLFIFAYDKNEEVEKLNLDIKIYYNLKSPKEIMQDQIGDYERW